MLSISNDSNMIHSFRGLVKLSVIIMHMMGVILAEKPFLMLCAQIVVLGTIFWNQGFAAEPKLTFLANPFENRMNSPDFKARVSLLLVIALIFPIRVYALGNSRLSFYFALEVIVINAVINAHHVIFRLLLLSYINAAYWLSPVYHWIDTLTLFSVSFSLIVLISALVSQQKEMKDMFSRQSLHMSSIYHEIKTPMNGIVCANELIHSNLDKLEESTEEMASILSQIREWLGISQSSSIALSEMIENILTFSKLQTAQLAEVIVKPVHIQDVLNPIRNIVTTYPKSSKVKVEINDCVDKNIGVVANQVALHQILLNIITNSLKFTVQGSVKLVVEENKILNTIEFQISDTGIGMSKTFLEEHLFQPFEQEGQPLVNSQRGVGLGMALSKDMTDKMGGTIRVTSQKGEGTTTVVSLPSVQVEPTVKEDDFTTLETKRLQSVKYGDVIKALVVDDNETNRKVMKQVLHLVGFQCILAQSGEESIEILNNQKDEEIRVIFMDVFMPGMGGIEASKEVLKIISKWKSPPLLVGCTADTSEGTVQACRDVGIRTFLHKPISRKALQKLILSL